MEELLPSGVSHISVPTIRMIRTTRALRSNTFPCKADFRGGSYNLVPFARAFLLNPAEQKQQAMQLLEHWGVNVHSSTVTTLDTSLSTPFGIVLSARFIEIPCPRSVNLEGERR